jgi:DNA-binding protein
VYLKKFEEVELHALGEAINSAVNVAENMQRNGFSNIVSVV